MREGMAGPAGEVFTLGPWEFNVSRARLLAADRRKYRPRTCRPGPDWVGPNIDIDPRQVERSDLRKPVLFATVVWHGRPERVLIDGNHRAVKALRHQVDVRAITLDLEDTLKVLRAPGHTLEQMRQEGQRLGLLRPPAV
jgi:hypothetical protein